MIVAMQTVIVSEVFWRVLVTLHHGIGLLETHLPRALNRILLLGTFRNANSGHEFAVTVKSKHMQYILVVIFYDIGHNSFVCILQH